MHNGWWNFMWVSGSCDPLFTLILFSTPPWTDRRQNFQDWQNCGCGWDQSEISFSIPQGTLPWQPIFVGFIHRTDSLDTEGASLIFCARGRKQYAFIDADCVMAQPGGLTLHLVFFTLFLLKQINDRLTGWLIDWNGIHRGNTLVS